MNDKENLEKTITAHMATDTDGSVKEEDVQSSPLFIETLSKLEAAERDSEKMLDEFQSVMERWAVTKGDLEQSRKTIEDLEDKHKRRLKEITGEDEDGGNAEDIDNAKRLMQLEHKLKHALDTVRQAEALKSSLTDATKMNETLQRQISELKASNEQLEAAKQESYDELLTSQDENMSKEKIQKMKKEFSALMETKDQAKKNLEVRYYMFLVDLS